MSMKRLRDALGGPVFPPPPLKFRTAGFPQYGLKREFDRDLRWSQTELIHGQKRRSSLWRSGPAGQAPVGVAAVFPGAIPSRGPWLASRLCCPSGSMLTMASSEPLVAILRLIFFARRTLRRRVGPQFKLRVCSCMPSLGPRWTGRVPTVASPTALVFAILPEARHPPFPRTLVLTWAVSRGWNRFACATACTIVHPSPTRIFTFELASARSPRTDVEHNYTGKQSTPAARLSLARHTTVWAAKEVSRVGQAALGRLSPLQTGLAGFPHPAYPKAFGESMHSES